MIAFAITGLSLLPTLGTEEVPAQRIVVTVKPVDWRGVSSMSSVAAIPDRDGDGIEELAVFSRSDLLLTVLSGGSGRVLDSLSIGEPEADGWCSVRIAGSADFNSDGVLDLLLCGNRWAIPAPSHQSTNMRLVWLVVDGSRFQVDVGRSSAAPRVLKEAGATLGTCVVLPRSGATPRIVLVVNINTTQPPDPKATRTEIWTCDPDSDEQQRQVYDAKPMERVGLNLSLVGDVGGDGVTDLAMRTEIGDGRPDGGSVLFLDGATMRPIRIVRSSRLELLSSDFGTSISGGMDLDGDHVPDIVVGGSWPDHPVWCLSGATGALLRTIESPTLSPDPIGRHCEVLQIPDCDGDSVGDILVTHPDALAGKTHYGGRACIHSGATGMLLADFDATPGVEGDFFGQWCAAVRGSKEYKTILFCGGDKTTRWVGVR